MATWGCLRNYLLVSAKIKRRLLWNEEPYFVNLIPIIFVFTFVYSIILYAFSKVTEGNMLVSNHMIKTSCFRSDRGSDRGFTGNFVCNALKIQRM